MVFITKRQRRILVCGGRDYGDAASVWWAIRGAMDPEVEVVIISGGASGADTLAAKVAESLGLELEVYEADWKTYGDEAGPRRNKRMLREGKPHVVFAFPGGSGTRNMVRLARVAGVEVVQIPRRWRSA